MARAFDGPHISAPLVFMLDKNSSIFMLCYPKELSLAICEAIWANRSDVALPPAPPLAVCVVMYMACAGFGNHIVSLPDCSIKNLSNLCECGNVRHKNILSMDNLPPIVIGMRHRIDVLRGNARPVTNAINSFCDKFINANSLAQSVNVSIN